MLDLKAKLLQAGLVTDDQVEKVQAEQEAERAKRKAARDKRGPAGKGKGKAPRGKKGKGGGKPAGPQKSDDERWAERVKKLAEGGKSEQYDAIRGWVERTRLDDEKAIPSEEAEKFHFSTYDESISWLTLEPALIAKLKDHSAAISAFMSFNGLRHCVLPTEVAKDVAKIRPEWPRVLEGVEILTRPPPEPKDPSPTPDGAAEVVALPGAAPSDAASSDAASSDAASSDAAPSDAAAAEDGAADAASNPAPGVENAAANDGDSAAATEGGVLTEDESAKTSSEGAPQ